MVVSLVLGSAIQSYAQKVDFRDPVLIADDLRRADVVVIGTFFVHPSFPWFDGWHRRGTLEVQTVVKGNVKVGDFLLYRWLEPFLPASDNCDRLSSWFDKTQGIWFLKRTGDDWKLSGAHGVWCGGPLPMEAADGVLAVARGRLTSFFCRLLPSSSGDPP